MPKKVFKSIEEVKAFAAENPERKIVVFGGKQVLDITEFMNDAHPGGPEVFDEFAAGDEIKQGFEEVGHSEAAVNQIYEYVIGKIEA